LNDALIATFSDLATYFGNRPVLGSAYQDAHDPTSGGATFGVTFDGHPRAASSPANSTMARQSLSSSFEPTLPRPIGKSSRLKRHSSRAQQLPPQRPIPAFR